MPERPDLEVLVPRLRAALVGAQIAAVETPLPVLLRATVRPADVLPGLTVAQVSRHGGFVSWSLTGAQELRLAIHPMLAGRFSLPPAGARPPRDLGLSLRFTDDRVLWFRDEEQMAKVWVVPQAEEDRIIGWSPIGLDALDPAVFTLERFVALARRRRDQVKVFLLDHGAIDHLGNAYADEVMYAARVHPKARVSELSPEALARLHAAIPATLRRAIDEITRRQPALDEKVRDFLIVRNRKGRPCPACGDTIRVCGIHGHDAFFCPTCQPDQKARTLVDWRRPIGSD